MPRLWLARTTIAILGAVLVLCIYRAATQSLTIDEARVFELFVSRRLEWMAREYDACNHVLHTILMKIFRQALGTREIVLRIPSLLGAAVYLSAVFVIVRTLFAGWMQPAAAAALSLNPLLLDMLVAARGYGLASGLLLWAVYFAIRHSGDAPYRGMLYRAGLCAGLAISANLTVLVPAAALGIVLVAANWRRPWPVVERYGIPALLVAVLFNGLPLARAGREHFYVGVETLAESARVLLGMSTGFSHPALPALTAALAVLAAAWPLVRRTGAAAVIGAMPVVSVLLLVVLRHAAGLKYPWARTGLYLIPLFTLAVLGLTGSGRLRYAGLVAACALAGLYLVRLETRYFAEWQYDAGTRELMHELAARKEEWKRPVQAGQGGAVGVNWMLEHTANYYRGRYRLFGMERAVRYDTAPRRFDAYILLPEDAPAVTRLNLDVLRTHPLSGAMLAQPR